MNRECKCYRSSGEDLERFHRGVLFGLGLEGWGTFPLLEGEVEAAGRVGARLQGRSKQGGCPQQTACVSVQTLTMY